MKKIVLLALAASTAAVATPAFAQTVTGTITLEGSVGDKCLVLPGAGNTFGDTIDLGELAGSAGTLRADIATEVNDNPAMETRIVCTTANPMISVTTTALATSAPSVDGYDNSIDFDTSVDVTTIGGTYLGPFTTATNSAPLASTAIGGRLANNGGNNVTITTSDFRTDEETDLLVADLNYSGSIVVVIAPGT